jgi:hypothetical protein
MKLLTLNPEPQTFAWLKQPYDDDFHKVLKYATERCLPFTQGEAKALVTDRTVYILAESIPLKVISYFTAYANKLWNGRGLLVFFADQTEIMRMDSYTDVITVQMDEVEKLSRSHYEMYMEEHKFDLENGLFPDYSALPFHKTPRYYQRGIIVPK